MSAERDGVNHVARGLVAGVVAGLLIALFGPMLQVAAQRPHSSSTSTGAVVIAEAHEPEWHPASNPISPQSIHADKSLAFEREYGIDRLSRSQFLSMVQAAKYGLDTMTFTAQQQAKRLEFTHTIGDPTAPGATTGTGQPDYALPLFGTFGRMQLLSLA